MRGKKDSKNKSKPKSELIVTTLTLTPAQKVHFRRPLFLRTIYDFPNFKVPSRKKCTRNLHIKKKN